MMSVPCVCAGSMCAAAHHERKEPDCCDMYNLSRAARVVRSGRWLWLRREPSAYQLPAFLSTLHWAAPIAAGDLSACGAVVRFSAYGALEVDK